MPRSRDGVGAQHDKERVLKHDEGEDERAAVAWGQELRECDAVHVQHEENCEGSDEKDGAQHVVGAKSVRDRGGIARQGHAVWHEVAEERDPQDPPEKQDDSHGDGKVQAAAHDAPVHEAGSSHAWPRTHGS